MDQMLEGIEGATAIMDDILIAGSNTGQHDAVLRKVIERATTYNFEAESSEVLNQTTSSPIHRIPPDI